MWNQYIIFLLAGHKVHFIAPCGGGGGKSIFQPPSRKKIVCNAGKTFILFVWLLDSLCSGIKLHTRKINFFPLLYNVLLPTQETRNNWLEFLWVTYLKIYNFFDFFLSCSAILLVSEKNIIRVIADISFFMKL